MCCCVAQRSPSSPRKSHFTNMNTERLLLNTSWKDSGMFVCPQVSELPPHPLSRKNSRVSKPVWWQILIPQQLRENHCGVTWQPRHVTESHSNCDLIQKLQTEVVFINLLEVTQTCSSCCRSNKSNSESSGDSFWCDETNYESFNHRVQWLSTQSEGQMWPLIKRRVAPRNMF